jgi:transcriptional regulator with XRE-family HTH domain
MGSFPRIKPSRLAEKLTLVRGRLGFTQAEMAEALSDKKFAVNYKDISRFEKGDREPSLMILLRYSRLAKVKMEIFADDSQDLPE